MCCRCGCCSDSRSGRTSDGTGEGQIPRDGVVGETEGPRAAIGAHDKCRSDQLVTDVGRIKGDRSVVVELESLCVPRARSQCVGGAEVEPDAVNRDANEADAVYGTTGVVECCREMNVVSQSAWSRFLLAHGAGGWASRLSGVIENQCSPSSSIPTDATERAAPEIAAKIKN